jgi:uncharacterized protein YndB with AHSA1/START domain
MCKLSSVIATWILVLGLVMWGDGVNAGDDATLTSSTANASPEVATIVRDFDSAPEVVWRAWTEPAQMRRWYGSDPNGEVTAARADVRVGGSYSVTFVDSDGTRHTASGEYTEVEPYSRLAFSWHWESEPGVASSVTVLLEPNGEGTRMLFQHAGIGYGSSHNFEQGWQSTFDKLERALVTPE